MAQRLEVSRQYVGKWWKRYRSAVGMRCEKAGGSKTLVERKNIRCASGIATLPVALNQSSITSTDLPLPPCDGCNHEQSLSDSWGSGYEGLYELCETEMIERNVPS